MIDINAVAAVKLVQKLEPISKDEPVKPPTFASSDKDGQSQYIIYETKGRKDAVLDTAPSQANRIEPLFQNSGLIPEVTVDIDGNQVSITELGHRSCDAAIRFSTGAQEINTALNAYQHGDAEPLAKLAPLDILFGSWDSRASRTKITRTIRSVIRATDVSEPIKKLGQFRTSLSKEPFTGFSDEQLSEFGILDCPVGGKKKEKDGVIVNGEIARTAELNVRAIRRLKGHELQNYVLGLGLFALTAPMALDLREGCNLVITKTTVELVNEDGTRTELNLTHEDTFKFAKEAAEKFGVGQARHYVYDPKAAAAAITGKKEIKSAKKAKAVELTA